MHTTLQTLKEHLHLLCPVDLLLRIFKKRTVEQAPLQPEENDFQRPNMTEPSISALRVLVKKLNTSPESPH